MTTTLSTETGEESTVQYKDLIHRAIRGILIQVPTGRSVLFPILCEFFPHKRFSRNVQTEYTAQLLQICRYEPMLQARILELIVSKCLEMDVEIVIEDSGDVRIDQQALDDGDLDFDDAFEDMAYSFNSSRGHSRNNSRGNLGSNGKRKQLTETSATRIPAEVSEMADKLDSVLLLVAQFCEQQITSTGAAEGAPSAVPSSGARDRLLQQLLGIFETNIMSIHKSKFVQFIIFYAASLHNPFAQAVAEKLVGITLDERASATQRQSAVMYLASYLSRATFLSAEFIRYAL
jgi:RNA polymerase I-specific transcription initiation factor RRN3